MILRVIGSIGPSEVFTTVVTVVMVGGIARLLLRERRASSVRAIARDDPVVCEFDRVRVQVNRDDMAHQSTLKSGGLGNRVLVHSRSLQIGPYSFEASGTTMEHGRAAYGWHDLECVILSGTYGGDRVRLALHLDGGLAELWEAFHIAGVRAASPPPPW